ncbi:MAG: hypothetical protein WC758_02950 [Candidatus Woesearchaeota archaeon]|jgi:hypothetical protein
MIESVAPLDDVRILSLFNSVDIKIVILVDDNLSAVITLEKFLEKAKAIYDTSANEKLKEIFNESFPNDAVLEKKLKELFERYSSEEKNTNYTKLNEILVKDAKDSLDRDLSSFADLSNIFKNKVLFHKLSPEDWEQQKDEFMKNVNPKNKILILFDKELGNGKNSRRYIDEIIENTHFDGLIFCGLFTHTLHTCKDEWREWENEFKKKYNIYPLAKERTQHIDRFLHGLKLIILNFYTHNLIKEYSEIIDKTNSASLEKINNLDINHFDQIILQSSLKEGILEEDTFIRLYELFHNSALIRDIKKSDTIGKITKLLREINKTKIDYLPEHREDIKTILKDDRYEDSDFLNQNHISLGSGDIFCSDAGDYYILLTQPCDIMLRSDGRSIAESVLVKIVKKNSSIDFILKQIREGLDKAFKSSDEESLEKIKKEELKKITLHLDDFSKTARYYPLEHFMGESETYYIDFSKAYGSNLLPLDLCSLNTSGECQFLRGENYNLNKNISLGFEKNLEDIKKRLEQVNSGDKIPKIIFNENLKGKYDPETKLISYPLKRVNRLKNPYLSDILLKFSNHLFRVGVDYDLAKM